MSVRPFAVGVPLRHGRHSNRRPSQKLGHMDTADPIEAKIGGIQFPGASVGASGRAADRSLGTPTSPSALEPRTWRPAWRSAASRARFARPAIRFAGGATPSSPQPVPLNRRETPSRLLETPSRLLETPPRLLQTTSRLSSLTVKTFRDTVKTLRDSAKTVDTHRQDFERLRQDC